MNGQARYLVGPLPNPHPHGRHRQGKHSRFRDLDHPEIQGYHPGVAWLDEVEGPQHLAGHWGLHQEADGRSCEPNEYRWKYGITTLTNIKGR